MNPQKAPRFVPSWWYVLLCLAPLGFVVWMWSVDAFGDTGMKNVFSALGVVLAGILWFSWFLFRSAVPARRRWGTLAILVALIVVLSQLVRFEGVSGSMVPSFSWRWSPERGVVDADPTAASKARVDLTKTSSTDFPGFLGARRDMTVRGVHLARSWDASAPELLWKKPIGKAWSAFAIVNGVALTQEQRGDRELVTAYDLASGDLLWKHSELARKTHPVGGVGPRCTPLVDEGRVYALGATGILVCLNGVDGKVHWRKDLLADFGITPEQEVKLTDYGRSTSPLIVGERLIVPVGGADKTRMAGLVAFDKVSGTVLWKGPPRHVSCASPSFATVAGRAQILVANEDTVSGHDPASGAMLWEHPWPARTSQDPNCSQVAVVGEDRVLVSKGYGRGSAVLRLVPRDAGDTASGSGETPFRTEVIWASRRSLRTKFTNVVVVGDYVYALSDGRFECVELATGKRVWKDGRYGHGQILLVEDLLLVLTEEGELLLIEPRADEPNRVLARMQALEGKTWNNLALSGDLLAVRNAHEAAVYRLPLREGR